MQFTKNTSSRKSILGIVVKISFVIVVLIITIALLNKIDFPSPKKKIEKTLPNEKFKIVK